MRKPEPAAPQTPLVRLEPTAADHAAAPKGQQAGHMLPLGVRDVCDTAH